MSERDDELDGKDDDWLDEDDDAPVRPRRASKAGGKARKVAGAGAVKGSDDADEAASAADADADDDGELEAYPQRSGRRPSGSGSQRRSPADDDLDDDWDEEDDWDRSGPGGQRRDLTYVIGIVAVVIIVVLVVLLVNKDDDKGSGDNAATTTTPGQTTPEGGTQPPDKGGFCGNLPPQLGGQGKVAATGPDGVYMWSDFFGFHIRGKAGAVQTVKITATAEIKVKDAPDPKNDKEKELYTKDYAAWRDAASKGGKTELDGNVLTITLPASTTPLGPNLDIPCEVTDMTIEVQDANGGDVAADQIHLGDTGQAVGNPFEVKREPGK